MKISQNLIRTPSAGSSIGGKQKKSDSGNGFSRQTYDTSNSWKFTVCQNRKCNCETCLKERTFEVNRMGENSSFIFTCYVKTVPVYDVKLVWEDLHPTVKEFFTTIH